MYSDPSHPRPVRLAYQPPASGTFLSVQISHQQPASSTFLSEQISTNHQPPAKRTRCQLHSSNSFDFRLQKLSMPNVMHFFLVYLWYKYEVHVFAAILLLGELHYLAEIPPSWLFIWCCLNWSIMENFRLLNVFGSCAVVPSCGTNK
jgi:hypothetical protein